MTSVGSGADLPPEQRQWRWEHPVGPRWLLLDSYDDDIALALCVEIEGLFVDLPPRPRERFALVGCTPEGVLAALLDRLPTEALGTERAWLGDLSVQASSPPPGWREDLDDVVVLDDRTARCRTLWISTSTGSSASTTAQMR